MRTPWYIQTDFNFQQSYKVSESKTLSFQATIQNLFNQRSVTSVEENVTSGFSYNYIAPGGLNAGKGTPFYEAAFQPYNISQLLNAAPTNTILGGTGPGPVTVNSGYGLPNRYQLGRTIRLGVKFTF